MRALLLTAAAITLAASSQAEQLIEARSGGVVTGHVSSSGVTRISFVGDAAASVQLAQGGEGPGFSLVHEPTTGDLYLTLARDPGTGEAPGAASFFVTTRAGFTYQVELAARDVPSTQIAIRNGDLAFKRAEAPARASNEEARIVALTRAMWTGALIDGFDIRRPRAREQVAGSVRLRPAALYEGEGLTGRVLTLRNPAPGAVTISEDLFLAPGVLAVVIKGERTLQQGETAEVLIVDAGGRP